MQYERAGLILAVMTGARRAVREEQLRPAALALYAMLGIDLLQDDRSSPALLRALFVLWPAPTAALVLYAFGSRRGPLAAMVYAASGVTFAGVRAHLSGLPLPWLASFSTATYRSSRLATLTAALVVARRPRTTIQAVALVLVVSAAWDLVGWYASDPWRAWGGHRPLALMTWLAICAIMLGSRCRTSTL